MECVFLGVAECDTSQGETPKEGVNEKRAGIRVMNEGNSTVTLDQGTIAGHFFESKSG